MKYIAREKFLHYKVGDVVDECEHVPVWLAKGHIEEVVVEKPVSKKKSSKKKVVSR